MTSDNYQSLDGVWQVSVWTGAALRIQTFGAAAKRHETGGILIGHYEDNGRVAIVEEATDRPRGSLFGAFNFGRGADGLAKLLAERWANDRYYLGEWHFHPGGSPEPSGRDHRTMGGIADNAMYRCEAPLLLILGQDRVGVADWSLHIYPKGMRRIMLRPVTAS